MKIGGKFIKFLIAKVLISSVLLTSGTSSALVVAIDTWSKLAQIGVILSAAGGGASLFVDGLAICSGNTDDGRPTWKYCCQSVDAPVGPCLGLISLLGMCAAGAGGIILDKEDGSAGDLFRPISEEKAKVLACEQAGIFDYNSQVAELNGISEKIRPYFEDLKRKGLSVSDAIEEGKDDLEMEVLMDDLKPGTKNILKAFSYLSLEEFQTL